MWQVYTKENCPKQGQHVLITDGKKVMAASYQPNGSNTYHNDPWIWEAIGVDGQEWRWDFEDGEITHWQPVPDLP